jgi:hypothetical protein
MAAARRAGKSFSAAHCLDRKPEVFSVFSERAEKERQARAQERRHILELLTRTANPKMG